MFRLLSFIGLCVVVFAAGIVQGQDGSSIEIAEAQTSLIQNTFVAAPMSGIIADVRTEEGSRVKQGDALIQLDTEQALTELEAARAALEAAQLRGENDVDIRYARRTMEVRQREVEQSLEANQLHPGTFSESEISKQQLQVDQARLAIEQAQHDHLVAGANVREKQAAIKAAETRLRRHSVSAPVAGDVVEVAMKPGEWVDAGEPLVRIISLDPIRVECFVDGNKYGDELVGREVEFHPNPATQAKVDSLQPKPLKGRVTFVSQELQPVTGQVRLWATIGNPDRRVRAGMHGRLILLSNSSNGSDSSSDQP